MQFFDFNIPYLEDPPSGKTTPSERAARKKVRLKLVVKAVELGYSGVAYNRSIKGVMSESDRCSVSLFPLPSLLTLVPSLSSSASFHRLLLSGEHAARSPFRQYTRITVSVDNPSQSSALNSGNPILKTYDLVAVRPMNQIAFDQACQFSEVDLISIDLSDKMPFRLKLPMVKAAITRGVYFEITYSSLIGDIQVRRQVISNAKLLVDWTRGKNLIVSGAAPSVLEFRGPNDVANLLSLLGLATEHAKAAISKNCRSLIAKTLRKKLYFKEAIRVNMMPSAVNSDPKKPWIIDSMEWDPISSGEGDLLLEDLAKSFSEANKGSAALKSNGFTSSVNNVASHGLKVTNLGAQAKNNDVANDSIAPCKETLPSSEPETIRFCSQRKPMSLFSTPLDHCGDVSNTIFKPCLSKSENALTDSVNTITSSVASESRLKSSGILDIGFAPIMIQEDQRSVFSQKSTILNAVEVGTEKQSDSEVSAQFKDKIFVSETVQPMMVDDMNADSSLKDVTVPSPLTQTVLKDQSDPSVISSDCLLEEDLEVKACEETDKNVISHSNKLVDLDSDNEGKGGDNLIDRDPTVKDGLLEEEMRHKEAGSCKQDNNIYLSTNSDDTSHVDSSKGISNTNDLLTRDSMLHGEGMDLEGDALVEFNYQSKVSTKSVKRRIQQRGYIRFPFKHLLQVPFKRKAVAYRRKIKKR